MEELFSNIDENTSEVIMNFESVEFMGRSIAQEYLNQKHFASFEVIEKNGPHNVEKMLDIILKLNNKEYLDNYYIICYFFCFFLNFRDIYSWKCINNT